MHEKQAARAEPRGTENKTRGDEDGQVTLYMFVLDHVHCNLDHVVTSMTLINLAVWRTAEMSPSRKA